MGKFEALIKLGIRRLGLLVAPVCHLFTLLSLQKGVEMRPWQSDQIQAQSWCPRPDLCLTHLYFWVLGLGHLLLQGKEIEALRGCCSS